MEYFGSGGHASMAWENTRIDTKMRLGMGTSIERKGNIAGVT